MLERLNGDQSLSTETQFLKLILNVHILNPSRPISLILIINNLFVNLKNVYKIE